LARRVICGALAAAAIVTIVILGTGPAHAEDGKLTFLTLSKQPGILELGAGEFALIDNPSGGRWAPSPEFNVDSVFAWDLVNFWGLMRVRPMIGAFVTTEESAMGYLGLHGSIPIVHHFEIDPFGAVGRYSYGKGRDMGSEWLFHAGFTGYYVLDSGYRFGLTYAHESNGGRFPHEHPGCLCNPGANDIQVTLGIPFTKLLGY